MKRRAVWLLAVLPMIALSACSGGNTETPQSDASLPQNATVTVGSEQCRIASRTTTSVEGRQLIKEHFICQDTMSDPRVSGTADFHLVTWLDGDTGGIWISESATLTASGGTWRGTARGALDSVGVLPTARGVTPYNYGVIHWIGQGAYDGLEYDVFISGSNEKLGLTGWITEPS